jgi:hypothetical protein
LHELLLGIGRLAQIDPEDAIRQPPRALVKATS